MLVLAVVGGSCAHVAGQAGATRVLVAEGSDSAGATWVEADGAALVIPKRHGRPHTGGCFTLTTVVVDKPSGEGGT